MNKEQLIRYAADEFISKGNVDLIPIIFSTDYIAHAGEKSYQGHNFLKRWTKQIHTAIENLQIKNILILSQTEDTITWQRTLTGKHQNALRGIPPSGKIISWSEMVLSRFSKHKIVEEWVVSELAAELMLKQVKRKT